MTAQVTERKIAVMRALREGGMMVKSIAAHCGVSRETASRYTRGIVKVKGGKIASDAPRFEARRELDNGTIRTVYADTQERADQVCSWQPIGSVAARIAARVSE